MAKRAQLSNQPLTESVLAGFIGHPAFLDAGRALAAGTVQLFLDHPAMRYFDKDRGTTLVNLFAVCLSFSEDGLTMARLKAICEKSRACSVGRAIRIIGDLRARGDIVPADPSMRTRPQRLALSDRLLAYHRDWLRLHHVALDKLSPGSNRHLHSDDPVLFAAHMRALGGILEESADLVTADTPILNLFADHDGGMLMLLDLIAQRHEALVSRRVRISVQSIAKRLGISRVHVLAVLHEAHIAKLVIWSVDTRELTLSPALVHSLKRYFAVTLMIFTYCVSLVEDSAAA